MSSHASVSENFGDGHFLGYLLAQPTADTELHEQVMHTQASSSSPAVTVALDSGATRSCFKQGADFQPLQQKITVQGALPGLTSSVRGTVALPCPAVPGGSLRGLHSESFRHNLVSLSDLQQQGVEVLFPANSRTAICRDPKSKRVLWSFRQGSLGLYEATVSPASALSVTAASSQQWFVAGRKTRSTRTSSPTQATARQGVLCGPTGANSAPMAPLQHQLLPKQPPDVTPALSPLSQQQQGV
jgi:hypothetical protein